MDSNFNVRAARTEDIPAFQCLWKACFGDSDTFIQWLFSNRFYPELSVVLEKDGEILSCMQGVPYTVLVRGKEIPSVMLCGVSTHPDHRGKGYMKAIFTFTMNLLREKNIWLAVHTPAELSKYFSYGHFPVADATYVTCQKPPKGKPPFGCSYVSSETYGELFPLYEAYMAKKFSGIIQRTEAEFLRKCADYAADGGKALVYADGALRGYAFVYDTEDAFVAVEAVAEDGYYHKLVEGVLAFAQGKKVSIKLPANLYLNPPQGEIKQVAKGVAGVAHIQRLLEVLEISSAYSVEFLDRIVKENQGVFSLDGKISQKSPAFAVETGRFLGVLLGYVSLDEIRPFVTIYNEGKYEEINAMLKKKSCYIIDEY